MCERLGIESELDKALGLVETRNTQDVGHARLHETLRKEDANDCKKLVILEYINR